MDYQKLFTTQSQLDHKIVEGKQLQGVDLFKKKVQALGCEIQECANEERSWKFWSEDQEARREVVCSLCDGSGEISAYWSNYNDDGYLDVLCPMCEGYESNKNPLLEEYVDCLHFILSLGNDLKVDIGEVQRQSAIVHPDVTSQFISLTYVVSCIALHNAKERYYFQTVGLFKGLVHLLGFTEEQLENAYYSKNEVNHERQNNNY